jgi:hypothetical protein
MLARDIRAIAWRLGGHAPESRPSQALAVNYDLFPENMRRPRLQLFLLADRVLCQAQVAESLGS